MKRDGSRRGGPALERRRGIRVALALTALGAVGLAAGAVRSVRATTGEHLTASEARPSRAGTAQVPAPAGVASGPAGTSAAGAAVASGPATAAARTPTSAPSLPVEPAPGPDVDALWASLDRVLDGARWQRAEWSVLAVSLDRGDTLYARDPERALAPASNVKIITSAAALHYLGPEFRYPTYLLATGETESGVLQGDLVLYGTGDPALSKRFYRDDTEVFRELARDLKDAGIQAVAGDLVGDGTYYRGPAIEPSWDPRDLNEWYAAPVSALSYNENMVSLKLQAAGWIGAPPRVETVPVGAELPIENTAVTVGAPPEAWRRIAVLRASHDEPMQVVGEIQAGSPDVWRAMTVSDPPLYAATMFRRVLLAEGIEVYGRVRSVSAADESVLPARALWAPGVTGRAAPRVVAVHHSPPLVDLLEVVNNQSHNLFAETLLRTMGAATAGDPSFGGGVAAVRRFLTEQVKIESPDLTLVDGSGLSDRNRASAGDFVLLMEHMARSDLWEAFYRTLPEAGNRRELARMYRSPAAGNLRAKTGTIERVSALSGVVRTASGEQVAFSILANGVPSTWRAKRLEDRIGIALADFRRP